MAVSGERVPPDPVGVLQATAAGEPVPVLPIPLPAPPGDLYCLWCGGEPTEGPYRREVIVGAGGRICGDCIDLLRVMADGPGDKWARALLHMRAVARLLEGETFGEYIDVPSANEAIPDLIDSLEQETRHPR